MNEPMKQIVGRLGDVASTATGGVARSLLLIIEPRRTSGAQLGQPIFDDTARADMQLAPFPAGPDQFRGSITLVREMTVGHVTPRCAGSATQSEEWDVIARVNAEAETIELAFNQSLRTAKALGGAMARAGISPRYMLEASLPRAHP